MFLSSFCAATQLTTPFQATVGAIGIMSNDHCLYNAFLALISGQCSRETGCKHLSIIKTTLNGIAKSNLHTISIASDGESHCSEALIHLRFKKQLEPSSPIYPTLSILLLMNLKVGDDDVTTEKITSTFLNHAKIFFYEVGVSKSMVWIFSHLCFSLNFRKTRFQYPKSITFSSLITSRMSNWHMTYSHKYGPCPPLIQIPLQDWDLQRQGKHSAPRKGLYEYSPPICLCWVVSIQAAHTSQHCSSYASCNST